MQNVEIRKYKKVMVANRGEIAIRVYRALNELGIQTVGIFSKEDKYALFRTKTDEAYMLNPEKGPLDAYLDIKNIIKIAKAKGVDAIHPGYGFLSENPEFVQACEKAGIAFIGPNVDVMYKMGDKISSKKMAIECNVPIIPGVDHAVRSLDEVMEVARKVGYPVMLKASNGGGGRGMRIVNSAEEMPKEFEEARNEAKKAFGDDKIFVEKYLRDPKHIEVQVLGDKYGNVVHLFDRDCSVQRRHQKVIEFAPAFTVSQPVREKILADAVRLSKHVGYKNAGTLEFLVDADENYYFIEMNPRIQVEHTVSEEVTGIDIVQAQILRRAILWVRPKSAFPLRRMYTATAILFSCVSQRKTLQTISCPIQARLTYIVPLPATVSVWMAAQPTQAQRLLPIMTACWLRLSRMTEPLRA